MYIVQSYDDSSSWYRLTVSRYSVFSFAFFHIHIILFLLLLPKKHIRFTHSCCVRCLGRLRYPITFKIGRDGPCYLIWIPWGFVFRNHPCVTAQAPFCLLGSVSYYTCLGHFPSPDHFQILQTWSLLPNLGHLRFCFLKSLARDCTGAILFLQVFFLLYVSRSFPVIRSFSYFIDMVVVT